MSRIGKKPIPIPEGVTASLDVDGQRITAKGPLGELSFSVKDQVFLKLHDRYVHVNPVNNSKRARSFWGLSRTMILNIFIGVKDGYEKNLEISGVGYRCAIHGKNLKLSIGFSHEVIYKPPQGITLRCPKPTEIVVLGHDKQVVGQVAAEIREYRVPEPYKGKGIKYVNEILFRKEGKKK
ncbi:50S ribosomal protein L6 [Candidatus Endowatersipora endosymbiont of Watersipora subatra]|uniref:50S ribosomal protein L6 n=1 Tax=Candidatus Endowatersipora endosymbiont of Watersipora subatra TaxID=3077946 RepID=UPI00312CAE98